ncbi:MAG TPA: hypothetical protein VHN80_19565 [Kineosporiaceae bacterium]|nr:hypothetical protein [Kineosporiaceae bacterium]
MIKQSAVIKHRRTAWGSDWIKGWMQAVSISTRIHPAFVVDQR